MVKIKSETGMTAAKIDEHYDYDAIVSAFPKDVPDLKSSLADEINLPSDTIEVKALGSSNSLLELRNVSKSGALVILETYTSASRLSSTERAAAFFDKSDILDIPSISNISRKELKNNRNKKDYGANNQVFTKDDANNARAVLRKKLKGLQHNAGIDPEIAQAGLQLAGFHIEAGAHSFADYSRKMVEDLGDAIKPYLKGFYMNVFYHPGFNNTEMDGDIHDADVDKILAEDAPAEIPENGKTTLNDNFIDKAAEND